MDLHWLYRYMYQSTVLKGLKPYFMSLKIDTGANFDLLSKKLFSNEMKLPIVCYKMLLRTVQ